ncbi:MAG: hypothetical protein KF745_08210 [Phycisphaeraceae bacterium]|nr:hypothetical protein [Phycisphaeraceae bacterium]
MFLSPLLSAVLIFLARIADVSLDTLRLVSIIQGRRGAAWVLGFLQVLIWLYAVSSVLSHIQQMPWLALPYALGYATGNYVGVTIEQWLGYGVQVVRIFTRRGAQTAAILRGDGFGVTEIDGRGKDGPVSILTIVTRRRAATTVTVRARELDPACFFTIDDVRFKSAPVPASP